MIEPMTVAALHRAYSNGAISVGELLHDCLARARNDSHQAWISLLSDEQLETYIINLADHSPADLPLYGIPFAIKDNIDLADLPTTAGCPDYSYQPSEHAFVVAKLIAAGAVPIGKTNLDQFATGLVGTRSPYGECHNSINGDYISGGSSAGSAVSVADGQVVFSLGTDTAGSGRVPAAFNNILGLKGSIGRISCRGVVPACKSLDCVTIFAKTSDDLAAIWPVAAQFDEQDEFARLQPELIKAVAPNFKFGVASAEQLEFFADDAAKSCYHQAITTLTEMGGQAVIIDLAPFSQAAKLLYEGPWVAERLAALREFFSAHQEQTLPVIQTIIGGAANYSAADAYAALYQLKALKRQADQQLAQVDFIVTPTTGTIYTIDEVKADPITLNSNLGFYTNFMNLLDYSAIALPAGFRQNGTKQGLPFGITLFGPAFYEDALLSIASRWQKQLPLPLGALQAQPQTIDLCVCGAHLSGMALNHQLSNKGAKLIKQTHTAPSYRLFALNEGFPRRPAMVRDTKQGTSIEVEIWRLGSEFLAEFLMGIGAPLGLGKVELEDGQWVSGFISEPCATDNAEEITHLKSWRNFKA
ncbi:allophanate hydrolase [Celerinatantimonas diazotrophica]|uniref:Allophanate hydrolase n=1 Tax=Celerinatantimonas diazotrophica TaxID=412034 RepID=A0A4R1JLH7_9GAMM|nr:allophanate hydrolase [Celerinatantimonas diazotrophica]TCK51883.1 allophanate hydrolase [Celerinatantimonas diazotrophica]CAG9296424.1 Allophanate hydrolase [Celerinatantimonas diazotrophica]